MRSEKTPKRTQKKRTIRKVKKMFVKCLLTIFIIGLFAIGGFQILTKANTADDTEKVYYKYYTQIEIQGGDSLWSIAGRYMENGPYESRNDYMKEVIKLNQLSSTKILKGQYLVVPYYEDVYK